VRQVTVVVAPVNDKPTGQVSISGSPIPGEMLNASNTLADADGIPISGLGAIAYHWMADGSAIAGASGSSLLITQSQAGKAITAVATYTDNDGTNEAVTSASMKILDNVLTLAVNPAAGTAEDGTANLVYTFSRTGPTTAALIVNYTVGGTATLGTDYTGIAITSATKTVSFAANSATAIVTVDPMVDITIEPDETVALTLVAGAGYSIGTTEAVTGRILNDDATIEAQGNTKLLRRGDGKAFVENGTGVQKEITSPWNLTAGTNTNEWQMLAADTIGGVNKILLRNNTANFLHIWNLDANWKWQSSSGNDGFNTSKAWELETSFQLDATRDGITGSPFTTIETQGNTKLLRHSNGKAFVEIGTGVQREITSPWNLTAGTNTTEWQMLAADTIGGVNKILLRNNTANFLHTWSLDANWKWQSSSGNDGFNTSKAWELETSFQVDATRDGIIGSPISMI
jgi:methionine-rich copper-binding protein CopC